MHLSLSTAAEFNTISRDFSVCAEGGVSNKRKIDWYTLYQIVILVKKLSCKEMVYKFNISKALHITINLLHN